MAFKKIDPAYLENLHEGGMTWEEIGGEVGLSGDAVRMRVYNWRKKGGPEFSGSNLPVRVELPDEFDLDVALDVANKLQGLLEVMDPVITSMELRFPARPLAIMFSSCAHIGGRYTWHEGLRQTFNKMEAIDGLYVALMGDEIEGFLPGFRDAQAVADQVLPVKIQRAILATYLKRWSEAGKVLFGCHSQHGGQWFEQAVGMNPIKEEFQRTETPFFDGQGLVKMWVGEERYILAVSHGFKGSSIYNPNHPQRRASLFTYPSADIVVQGDKHKYSAQNMSDRVEEYYAGLRPSPLVWHIQAGTAKTGADKYTIRSWQRGWFEWPVLVFYPDRHVVKQAFEMKDLEWLLDRGEGGG
jgi:hypothetical protein